MKFFLAIAFLIFCESCYPLNGKEGRLNGIEPPMDDSSESVKIISYEYQPKKVSSIGEAFSEIEKFNKGARYPRNCWVAFDIDFTLTQPAIMQDGEEKLINKEHLPAVLKNFYPQIKASHSFRDKILTSTLFFDQSLIEKNAPDVISELQKRCEKVFALTACLHNEKSEKRRYEVLDGFGINFSKSAFEIPKMVLYRFGKYQGGIPTYSDGILYTNGECGLHNKGKVLDEFMQQIRECPQRFVIIDDSEKNIKDLQNMFAVRHNSTQFLGLLYSHESEKSVTSNEVICNKIGSILSD